MEEEEAEVGEGRRRIPQIQKTDPRLIRKVQPNSNTENLGFIFLSPASMIGFNFLCASLVDYQKHMVKKFWVEKL